MASTHRGVRLGVVLVAPRCRARAARTTTDLGNDTRPDLRDWRSRVVLLSVPPMPLSMERADEHFT
jgi:hypothetical protein